MGHEIPHFLFPLMDSNVSTPFYWLLQRDKDIFENFFAEVTDKCIIWSSLYAENAAESFKLSLRKYYECLVDAMGKASTTNGLTDEWKKFQPQFRKHLDLWNQCDRTGGKLKSITYVFCILHIFQN